VLVQTILLVASQDLSMLEILCTNVKTGLTLKCIARVKINGSFMVDSQVWCAVRRRKCVRGWDPKVDHS